jgi:hypothetical protein
MRGDHAAGAAGTVGHRRRDRQLPAAADLHPLHARVPAWDDLPLAELELERAAAVPGGVELLAGAEGDADVVHGDVRPGRRLGAVADGDVLDPELERDVSLGVVDLWALRCHRARTYTRARVTEVDDN